VTYTFTANNAGTYTYHSGSAPEMQVEMGLVGAMIIRPTSLSGVTDKRAYEGLGTAYDREYLFLLSEMDPNAHMDFEAGIPLSPARFDQRLWFINGRNGPDTMHRDGAPWMPHQPYGALAQMKPGERILLRIVNVGRDLHPFHHHGNNTWQIAKDGRVLESAPGVEALYPDYADTHLNTDAAFGAGNTPISTTLPDQSRSNFTVQTAPGGTYDAIFTWSGYGMNWDIYGNREGHAADDCDVLALVDTEDPSSHCVDMQVVFPEQQALTFGGFWTGSPFLGSEEALPPDQGGLNPNGGFSFMWHSHTERELTNDDIFPGGMMTMMIIEKPDLATTILADE